MNLSNGDKSVSESQNVLTSRSTLCAFVKLENGSDVILKKTIFSKNCLKLRVNDQFFHHKNNLRMYCRSKDFLKEFYTNGNFVGNSGTYASSKDSVTGTRLSTCFWIQAIPYFELIKLHSRLLSMISGYNILT